MNEHKVAVCAIREMALTKGHKREEDSLKKLLLQKILGDPSCSPPIYEKIGFVELNEVELHFNGYCRQSCCTQDKCILRETKLSRLHNYLFTYSDFKLPIPIYHLLSGLKYIYPPS